MARRRMIRTVDVSFDEGLLEGLHVKLKSLKFGEVRRLIALMDEDDKDVEIMNQISQRLADSIVSWDLQEEDGSPIEPSLDAIDDMDFKEVMELTDKWLDQLTGPSDELGKDSTSGVKFPGQPVTMEAL